jgi:DHA1 family bicyclomycin/chloramphenicol resistance-like MFS transporter
MIPDQDGRDLALGRLSRREFILLISMLMASAALAIDMMLPAFPELRAEFGLPADSNQVALVVTAFFFGIGLGQPLWGPLSDAVGRKPVLWAGLGVYVLSAVAAAAAPSLSTLLVARFVAGFGAASMRVVSMGVVRDMFRSTAMATTLSYIMAVFMLVPAIAPTLGTAVLALSSSWRSLFVVLAVVGTALAVWLTRLDETLPGQRRIPMQWASLGRALREALTHRFVLGLTLAQTAAWGFFTSFLASSQLIVADVFDLEEWFPAIFAMSTAALATGMVLNPRLLRRFSLRRVLASAILGYVLSAAGFTTIVLATGGRPPLALFGIGLLPMLVAQSLLVPNLNSAALMPMGHIAGTAAAVIGSISTLGGAAVGATIDRAYDGTLVPLGAASAVAALVALASWRVADTVWPREPAVEHSPAR